MDSDAKFRFRFIRESLFLSFGTLLFLNKKVQINLCHEVKQKTTKKSQSLVSYFPDLSNPISSGEDEGSDFEEEHPTRKKGKNKKKEESDSEEDEDLDDSDDEPRRKKVNLKRGKTPTKGSKSPAKKKSPAKSSSKKKDSEKEKAKPSKPKKKRGDDDDEDDIKKMFMPGQKNETPPDVSE